MPFSAAAARVVVTRDGQVVWDSGACKVPGSAMGSGTGSGTASEQGVSFTQGVPQEVTLSWNREAKSQGCAGSLAHGESGTFDAVAMADGIASKVYSFTLKP